ncbi:MAG: MinD/ParA family protein [Rhodospirillaceae bacterium]|jgi:flagellar biosynthesis protein FlhG|nr:MinD/ParA family protein [Rhodospirillaceae bacterium]MBT4218814.1 MinD/ParA family protein [Rhodospirillaceae bacterium]MBT4463797.1 MinD/ParA family protein [Rhodospirillaceae bacterium]MBT5013417.1 MinD/ParA family protein [Rhodospirillaceae bacterium]MBT7356119.1 MinD/ParA family protein [Rhodospirillaceae bacterium]
MSTSTTTSPLAPRPSGRSQGQNMIAIASGKGGVGKTWFAITLTHALARENLKTLLFDGDLALANLDIQLGLMPKHDLGSVIAGRLTLNQAVLPYEDGNFDIVAGRSGSGGLANVPASRLQVLGDDLVLLSAGYDKVIIDLGAGVERTVRQLTHNVGTCLVVATDEPTSLTDAYAFIKVTHMERPGADIRIVINMANSTREGERTYNTLLKACEGFLKISPPLIGVIRRDNKVRESIKSQSSILTRFPNTEAATDVEEIAAKLKD